MSGLHHPAPHHPPSNLLQAALLSGKLASPRQPPPHDNDDDYASEDETDSVVGVETPGRALSPASSAGRKERVDLGVSGRSTDPLRAFPNDIGIQIFARLDFKSLARCARVSKRWNKSQTINYIWYRHHQEHQFSHGEDITETMRRTRLSDGLKDVPPAGRWGRKEAKEDWRRAYKLLIHAGPNDNLVPYDPVDSPYSTAPPSPSASPALKLGPLGAPVGSKNEARDQYRELKGRKSKFKRGMTAGGGVRDQAGGFEGVVEDPYGDGRFDAPF